MTEKVKYAPKAVIEELKDIETDLLWMSEILESIENKKGDYPNTEEWVDSTITTGNEKLFAVVKHLFGDENDRLRVEPRYIVIDVPYTSDGVLLTYARVNGNHITTFFQKGTGINRYPNGLPSGAHFDHNEGFSKRFALEIVNEFGGGKIKEV